MIDAIVSLAGLLIPPVVDFAKKKFLKPSTDTPEATMSSLATTKPEVLPQYIQAITEYMKVQVAVFNRDVIGTPSLWVCNLRAAIRPVGVILSFGILAWLVISSLMGYKPDPSMNDTITGIRLSCETVLTSWFGSRISVSGNGGQR